MTPKQTHLPRRASPSASESVIRMTPKRSRGRSARINFRVPFVVYRVLRGSVPNLSAFLRGLVFEALERLPTWLRLEEFRLEVEVAQLCEELEKLQRWGAMLLKHGSYAKAYLDEVKGQGVILDRKPFYLQPGQHYRPPAKPEEILTLEELVKLREKLSIQLNQLLRRLIQLKKAQVSHHGDKQRNGGEES